MQRGAGDWNVETASAEPLVGDDRAAVLDPVRPLDHHGERNAERGDADPVAQQRRDMHRLAGAVDAALGVDEGVKAGGRRAPLHATVGQIEGGRFQTEKRVVAAGVGRDDQSRRKTALPARKPRFERDMPVGVGLPRRQDLVAARDQPHLGLRFRRGARERVDEHVDAVAGIGGKAEIGDDEPLGRERAIVVRARSLGLRRHDIDAGLEIADRLVDRKGGRYLGIERSFDGKLAAPHARAARLRDALEIIAVEIALEILAGDRVEDAAVADAIDRDRDRRRIHADDGNAALAAAREHVGLAGKAHEGLAVAHIDVEFGRSGERLPHDRWQSGPQRDGVALAVLEAFDAELLVVRRQRRLVLPGDGDEGREVGAPARQAFGELEAGARRRRIRIDGVVEQAEAVIGPHFFIGRPQVGDLAQFEREPHCIERRAPQFAVGERPADQHERVGLLAAVSGA